MTKRFTPRRPQAVCERDVRLAAAGRGPVEAGDWADRTVVAVTVDEA